MTASAVYDSNNFSDDAAPEQFSTPPSPPCSVAVEAAAGRLLSYSECTTVALPFESEYFCTIDSSF
jgi:hypothetical protein